MTNAPSILATCLSCLGLVACQPGDAPPAAADTPPAATATQTPAPAQPATAANGSIGYLCDGGTTLSATYREHDVTLRWPDGRSVTLPRAESASKGGGDVYVGESVSLQRNGGHVQLHDGNTPATACTTSGDGA